MSVQRFYEVGDAVKVMKSTNQDHEGWVLDIKEDVVNMIDHHTNDMVCMHYMGMTCLTAETVSHEMLATPPIQWV